MNRLLLIFCCAAAFFGPAFAPHLCRGQVPVPSAPSNVLRAPEAPPPATAPAPAVPAASRSAVPDQKPTAEDGDGKSPEDKPLSRQQIDKAEIEKRLKALEGAGLSGDDKQKATAFYQQALESFDGANQQVAAAKEYQTQIDALPEQTLDYQQRLAKPLNPYEDVSGEPLPALEQRAKTAEESLAHCREELAKLKAEPKRRSQRLAEIPKQIDETELKSKQAAEQFAALKGEDAGHAIVAARRAALENARVACEATLQVLAREQQLYQQGSQLITLRQDYYARYVPYKDKRLAQLREMVTRLNVGRERQAQQEARQAAEMAAETTGFVRPRVIAELAEENKELAERRAQVAADITRVTKLNDQAKTERQQVSDQRTAAEKQMALDEQSSLTGRMLRDIQAKLPNLRTLRRDFLRHEAECSEVLLRIYDLTDKRSNLANPEDLPSDIAVHAADLSPAEVAEIRDLLNHKREFLEQLIKTYNDYSTILSALHSTEMQLISETEPFAEFIAQRVLWIRSCPILSKSDVRPAAGAMAWSLKPRNWREAGTAIIESGSREPAQFAIYGMALIALAACQRSARRRLREFGAEANKPGCTRLRPTIHAIWLTVLVALPWPALLAFIGWSLDSLSESEFVRSLSNSLRFTALCLLLLELTRNLCRRGGVADAHFDWPDACLVHLRRRLRWFTVFGLPLVLWMVGLEMQSVEPLWSSSLGRVFFIALMLLLSAKLQRLLLARNSPYRQLVLIGGGSWLKLLQMTWRPAMAALPAALAVLAAVGYYYTAQQAAVRILQTAGMLLAVLALGGLTRRWLLVNRRRLAREQAKQRRAQLAAIADSDSTMTLPTELPDDAIDLAAVSEQTQKLVRTFLGLTTTVGLILIWTGILPAIAYGASSKLPFAETLTWANLLICLLVLAVTYVSVRGLPALLELVVLQHLPLDGGARYAITSMSRYLLTAVGTVAAFSAIDVHWKDVQWLVAAMSVGLGFGLQEIFANFVSGIILLFERPLRVGDIVTLGDKTGVVNRIRMRATTIVDWDRKEYIVPNKDLVTERLLNWTLSDRMNRIEIVLAVSHGSDTDRACSLLLEAAREQQHVLTEPAPSAAFEGFTDQGLKLVLRCFLPTLEYRSATIHQLYTTIDRKFRGAGIEIPSPPREMRIRLLREATPMTFDSHDQFTAKVDKQSAA